MSKMKWYQYLTDVLFYGGISSAINGSKAGVDAIKNNNSHDSRVNKGKSQTSEQRSGFPDWLQKYAQMGTDSDGNISSKAIGNGAGYSNTQLMDLQFNHDEAQIDRDWQERMYLQYQSPDAMMRQYDEAGVNSALMYGGVDINGPSGGSSASTSSSQAGEGPQAGFERVMGVMSTLMGLISGTGDIASQIKGLQNQTALANADVELKRSQKNKTEAEAQHQETENQWQNVKTILDVAEQTGRITSQQLSNALNSLVLDRESDPLIFEARCQQVLADLGLTRKTIEKTETETSDIVENRLTENRNATVNERNASTNERNASTNERNATVNERNASTNEKVASFTETHFKAQDDLFKSQASYNDKIKEVQDAVLKDRNLRNELNNYAKEHNLPVGDYFTISLYQYCDSRGWRNIGGSVVSETRFREAVWRAHDKGESLSFKDFMDVSKTVIDASK